MGSNVLLRWRCQRVTRRLLGPGARVQTAVTLQQRPGAQTLLIQFSTSGARALLKLFADEDEARAEAENLEAIGAVEGIRTPSLVGRLGGALLRDYVEGANLGRLRGALSEAEFAPHRSAALANLVAIHCARSEVEKRLTLRRPFASASLAPWLRRSWRKIEGAGVDLYRRRTGNTPAAWRSIDSDTLIDRLVADLDTGRGPAVLGHGDYHLGNLVLSEDGELFTLDLEKLCLAPPWYDLAGTLLGLDGDEREAQVDAYLDAMSHGGCALDMPRSEAQRLARSGILCRSIYYARMLTGAMKSKQDPVRAEQFGRLMDAVAEIAG
jgi:aminoglycoside phosphotransferase (APT) family kinase protein